MIGRRTQESSLIWGRRQRRNGRGANHSAPARSAGEASSSFALIPQPRRQGGPSQDRALYACGCGYVFDAVVSTSVDCPACGDTQAW